ncbi:MAG: DUF72 domain-containing protein [Planctomycetes bacterium]|nr:DUF72 domain-containing protein [Planctomycetota bacterium]
MTHGGHKGATGRAYVGTSGWYYDHWEGVLYPPKLAKAKRLDVYMQRYNCVELNVTYYRVPGRATFEGWRRKAPPGFVYMAKAHREITHEQKLRDCAEPVARFLEAVAPLGETLGGVLFQVPPSLHKDLPLLADFLAMLRPGRRYAFEFRHPSWECDEAFGVLRRAGVAHVVVSRVRYPFVETHTAPFAYYRLHGPDKLCGSPYAEPWLAALAERLAALAAEGTDSFTFFNNDIAGHAVRNADTLNERLTRLGVPRQGVAAGRPCGDNG